MVTWQRLFFLVGTGARWIKVTDGGHYDNLGVTALARRGVACILSIDATADEEFEYGDLERLGQRLREVGLDLQETIEGRAATAELSIVEGSGGSREVARVLYLKANADADAPHLADQEDETVLRIRGFRQHNKSYPHTPTLLQWYDWNRFDAYRLLGYRMASFYLAHADFDRCSLQ
jgi:hypothetical protein